MRRWQWCLRIFLSSLSEILFWETSKNLNILYSTCYAKYVFLMPLPCIFYRIADFFAFLEVPLIWIIQIIGEEMKRYAVIGGNLSYSYSKIIHEFLMETFLCFENGKYDLLERKSVLKDGFLDLPEGYDGFSITNPFKNDVAEFVCRHNQGNKLVLEQKKLLSQDSFNQDSLNQDGINAKILGGNFLKFVIQNSKKDIEQVFYDVPIFQNINSYYDDILSWSVNSVTMESVGNLDTQDKKIVDSEAANGCAKDDVSGVNNIFSSNIVKVDNTDIFGFLYTYGDLFLHCDTVCVLGKGATSNMVQKIAKGSGKDVEVIGREGLFPHEEKLFVKEKVAKKILLVNCTPIGTAVSQTLNSDGASVKNKKNLSKDLSEETLIRKGNSARTHVASSWAEFEKIGITPERIKCFSGVADLVYNPAPTPLVQMANMGSIPAIGGLKMLIAQAVLSQCIWNNLFSEDGMRFEKNTHVIFSELDSKEEKANAFDAIRIIIETTYQNLFEETTNI